MAFLSRFRSLRGPSVSGDPVRVVIVGAGKFAARTWYPLLRSMHGVDVAAACARSSGRVEPLARRHRIPAVYTNVEAMLDRERPEAVIAVLPPASVLGVARIVLGRGLPLFVEKPPGLSVLETAEMAGLARSAGVPTLVAFNRRYCPLVRRSKEMVEAAGGIQSVLVEFHKDKPAGGAGDDLVTDIIHTVDLLRALGGEVAELSSVSGAKAASGISGPAYHVLVRFVSGATGVLAAFRAGGARRERIELHGPGISVEIDPPEAARIHRKGSAKQEVLTGTAAAGAAIELETYGFATEMRLFLEAVRGGPLPPSTLDDALETMRLVEAIRETARAGTITLSAAPGPEAERPAPPPAPAAADPRPADQRPRIALLLHPDIRALLFPDEVLARLRAFAEPLDPADAHRRKVAARLIGEADGVITSWKSPRLTEEMGRSARNLKIIAHAAGSVKAFVDPVFFERGVAVTNAASAIAPSVGEMALALTLAGLRSMTRYDRLVKGGDFRKSSTVAPPDSRGLFGRRVGLVGFGRTAREFLHLLEPFGCEILVYDPFADPVKIRAAGARPTSLDEVLENSDVISLHTAYTPETHHLLNAERIAKIRDGALIVNTARGSLLDETALVGRLRDGTLSAALDVQTVEPLPAGSELATAPNVILTPHIAGPTVERLPELGRTAVEDLRLYFSGVTPGNLVTAAMLSTMA